MRSKQVLATVVAAAYAFTDLNREVWVYATGSTKARTRLYRMEVSKYIDEVQKDFHVLDNLKENERNLKLELIRMHPKLSFSNFSAKICFICRK